MKNQLKIIFVTDSLTSGGAERVMSILANEFSNLGFRVSIFSKSHKPSFYSITSKVKLIYPKTEINYKNRITTLFGRLKVYKDIYRFLKSQSPDIVIPFSTTTNGVIIPICKVLNIPVIASEHNNYKLKLDSIPVKIIKRYIYPLSNMITVLTKRDKEEYYGKFMNNVVVMPNPLPLEPSNVEILNRERIILAIGNLSRWKHKGFDNLLRIFKEISKSHPKWKLQIAGGGNPQYLKELIEQFLLKDKIELLGEVQNVQELMQQASILALPSRWEGLPMVLIEAMSQGLPCIAFDCFTGPGDIITHNVDGLLVDDQNNKKFIEMLLKVIDEDSLRERLSKNAIETSKKYQATKIVAKWQKLIEHTTENK